MKNTVTYLSIYLFFLISNTYSQIGSTCSQAHVVDNVPFIQNGLTTIGTSYNSLPCSGSGFSNYMSGKDYVFTFTPNQSADYTIKLTNTSPAVGLFVTNLCPDDPSVQCIANNKAALGNPSLTVALTSGNTYYIIVSSNNLVTPQTNFNIEINSCQYPPTASFSYIQNGLTVEFINNSQNAISYVWYFGDELIPPPFSPGDTNTNPTHTYGQYGDYVVTLIAYNECGQTDTLRDTITLICPGNMPVADFTYTVLPNGTVIFTSTSTDATQWKWFFGDMDFFPILPGDTVENPTHTYLISGTYTVYLIVYNECGSDTTSQVISVIITLTNKDYQSKIKVYPNPVHNNVIFIDGLDHFNFKITDLTGKLVKKGYSTNNKILLDNSLKGLYIIHVINKDISAKFLVKID